MLPLSRDGDRFSRTDFFGTVRGTICTGRPVVYFVPEQFFKDRSCTAVANPAFIVTATAAIAMCTNAIDDDRNITT